MTANWVYRNSLCMCSSGRRYKHCHGNLHTLELEQARALASQARRLKEQGLGRAIVSEFIGNERVVTVGDERYATRAKETFPGFLMEYIKEALGRPWFLDQMTKSETDMHPVALWENRWRAHRAKCGGNPGEILLVRLTGAGRAYIELAYDLYLLQHNVELQTKLIQRIKHPDQFLGALSETRVAATFVRAGYSVAFEDEGDSLRSHCEYVVAHRPANAMFSVEVKTKHWQRYPAADSAGIRSVRIATGRLLRGALTKYADHRRIVFIELSMPDGSRNDEPWWMEGVIQAIREEETKQNGGGEPASAAYVVVGNHPHHHHLDVETADYRTSVTAHGVGPTSFRHEPVGTLREVLRMREEHADFLALWRSIETHRHIPNTFDGSIPAFSSPDEERQRLLVGNSYRLTLPNGEYSGVLISGHLSPGETSLYCVYRLDSGEMAVKEHALTESELAAYRRDPDTFLGILTGPGVLNNDLETFDWLFRICSKYSRERLLEILKDCADIDTLRKLSQKELATEHCLRLVDAARAAALSSKPN